MAVTLSVPAVLRRRGRTASPGTAPVLLLSAALPVVLGAASVLQTDLAWAAAVALTTLIAIVERPVVGGLILVAVVPVTSGFASGVVFPMLRPSEAAILGIGAIFLLVPLRGAIRWNHLDWAVATYCIGSIAMGAFHEIRAGELAASYVAVIAPIQHFLLYRIVATTVREPAQRDLAVRILFSVSIPVSLIGVLQQLDIGPTRELIADTTRSSIFQSWGYRNLPRATSVFSDWHTFGGYLAVILTLGVACLTLSLGRQRRLLVLVAMACAGCALALTSTFTSIFAVGLCTLLILRRQRAWHLARWVIVLGGIATAFFGSFLTQRLDQQWIGREDSGVLPQTVDYRIEVWTEQYFPLVGHYWPLGYGTGVPPEIDWVYTESGYLTLLFRGGLPLLIAAALLIVHSHRMAARVSIVHQGSDQALALCALAIATALVPMNLVWPYLTNSGLSHVFFVVLALTRSADADDSARSVVRRSLGRPVDDHADRLRPVLPQRVRGS